MYIHRKYLKKEKIGEGVYGKVYKGVERATGDWVAMKRINFSSTADGVPSSSLREVALLKSLVHPNVVNLREVMFVGDNKIYMIMDYVESNLKMFIKSRRDRDQATNLRYTQSYLYQLLRALNFCHFNRILHRDIKPANILLDQDGNLKLADFGLGRCFNIPMMKMTHEVITLYYRAPEILLGAEYYSMPVDMWSVGTIFAEMVCIFFYCLSSFASITHYTHQNNNRSLVIHFSKRIPRSMRCFVFSEP